MIVSNGTCARPYTVSPDVDTCKSVAQANSVSTYTLITRNGLDMSCGAGAELPAELCLPAACQAHTWTVTDTCAGVAAAYNVSVVSFRSWNPIFDDYCFNDGPVWAGWTVCVGPPGGEMAPPPAAVPVEVPENAKSDSVMECAQWHNVRSPPLCCCP